MEGGGWVESTIRLISAEAEALLGLTELGNIQIRIYKNSCIVTSLKHFLTFKILGMHGRRDPLLELLVGAKNIKCCRA